MEIWKDELGRRCGCGTYVEKDGARLLTDFSCALSCKMADRCVGKKTVEKLAEVRSDLYQTRKNGLAKLLETVPEDELEVRRFFEMAFNQCNDPTLIINPKQSVRPLQDTDSALYDKVTMYFSEFLNGRIHSNS